MYKMNRTYTEAASVVGSELGVRVTRAVARGVRDPSDLCWLLRVHIHRRRVS